MPDHEKFSLIERSARTFESFLHRDFSARFYSEEFLTGLTARRLEIHARLGRSAGAAFFASTLIAFFDLMSGSEFTYGGLTIQIAKDFSPIVALFASSAMLQTTFTFIDEQIIFRILLKLGSHIGIQSFPFLLIDKAAINLWGDAMTPKMFGPKSGYGQKFSFFIVTVIAILAGSVMYIYTPTMIFFNAYQVLGDDSTRYVAKCISAFSCLLVIWSLSLGFVFIIRFRFSTADWIESTTEPTSEFAAKMRQELGALNKEEATQRRNDI